MQRGHSLVINQSTSQTYAPCSSLAFSRQMLFSDHFFKLFNVLEVWDELDRITAAVETSGPNHSHVTHRVACIRQDKLCATYYKICYIENRFCI